MQVLMAMSGGVDSSVAAAQLIDAGHDVVGVTMRLWGGESDTGCCSVADVDDARRVAQQLGIDHLVFNFTEDFDRHVVAPYVASHVAGLTPNPCIECNRHLKFDRLLDRADLLGFDAVATGHHARIVIDVDGNDAAVHRVARGADAAKDQSYVVHMLDQQALARTLFPVGHLTKSQVRERAGALGLRTATKPDSQDVCFITDRGRSSFLESRVALRPGRVVDQSGADVGQVDAVELVTIGQRRGIGGDGGGDRRYVVDVDVSGQVVTVGPLGALDVPETIVDAVTWSAGPVRGGVVRVQVSAHGPALPATISVDEVDGDCGDGGGDGDRCRRVSVRWREPHRRVAPGQSVVFYDEGDTLVLGGGIAR